MKIIFLGTPKFVVPVLEDLCQKHNVLAVFCQPDKLGNRNKLTVSPVKSFALNNNIPVYQPLKITDELVSEIKALNPDVMVVSAYGKILPQNLIDIAPMLNIHPSDLPKYRGSAPIQWALYKGETEIAISIMKLCFKMDAGDILLKEKLAIEKTDNAETLLEKSFIIGSKMLDNVLGNLQEYLKNSKPQNENEATVYPMIKKEDGKINFSNTAQDIFNQIRAFYIWPNAYCFLNGKMLKVFKSDFEQTLHNKKVGAVVELSKQGIKVACKNGFLIFKEVQIENGKRMEATAFINGKNIKVGDVLC